MCVFRHAVNFKSCYDKCAYQKACKVHGSPGQPLLACCRPGVFSVLQHKRCPESQDRVYDMMIIQPRFKESPSYITGAYYLFFEISYG